MIQDVFQQMKEKFGFKYVASTLRESHSASDNG
jgi:2-dehydro-3-deoxygluconokinase